MAKARRLSWGGRPQGWIILGLLVGGGFVSSCRPLLGWERGLGERCDRQAGFVWVPGGEFWAGSDRAERDYGYRLSARALAPTPTARAAAEQRLRDRRWFETEPDRHRQTLPAFCISTHLVTNADYQAFVQATGLPSPGISATDYQAQGFLVHPYDRVVPYLWQGDQYPPGQGQHPVVLVSYDEAIAYARWRGQRDGVTYRLPTALEWEKAARGEDGRYFPWGNTWPAIHPPQPGKSTRAVENLGAVGANSRSPYGVADLVGNVFEFTETQSVRQGETVSVMKGCSWDDLPGFCRAAYRHFRPLGSRHILFGFRLVMAAARPPDS